MKKQLRLHNLKCLRFVNSTKLIFIGTVFLLQLISTTLTAQASAVKNKASESYDLTVGVITSIDNPEKDLEYIKSQGFSICQMYVSDYSQELARRVKTALEKNSITAVSLICQGPGEYSYNFYEGPLTIGLVPRPYRAERIQQLKKGIDFCKIAGIPAIQGHFGFIPEDPSNDLYEEFIVAAREVANYAKEKGILVSFETGQETPITLLRAINDIGTGNIFINYDVANLILYGKANPVDGLDIVGKHVRSLHVKDGFYPVNPRELGKEVPIGEGKVDFPKLIQKLKDMNFKGPLIIEYELSTGKMENIQKAKRYLEQLIKKP